MCTGALKVYSAHLLKKKKYNNNKNTKKQTNKKHKKKDAYEFLKVQFLRNKLKTRNKKSVC